MPKEYSPFTPGQPVPIEFFVGRHDEVVRLKGEVAASAVTRLKVAFLTGERGIGKSSLASFVRFAAEQDHQILGLHVFLGGTNTLEEMVRRIFDRLVKESIGRSWQGKVETFLGDHIRKVGLFGVNLEFSGRTQDLSALVNGFASALRKLLQELRGEARGLFIILDDINGLADLPAFAHWIKSFVDEVATSKDPLPLCLLFVGLEERRQLMITNQPSLARVFDLFRIEPWSEDEAKSFFQNCLQSVKIQVEPDALQIMARSAGGLPVLAQEIGDAAFRVDEDGTITTADANKAMLLAANVVGAKHLEPQVYEALRSEKYRSILRKLANVSIAFRRKELGEHLTSEELKVLDNFLTKMKQLGVIQPDPEGGPGSYRFRNFLHWVYFLMESEHSRGPR